VFEAVPSSNPKKVAVVNYFYFALRGWAATMQQPAMQPANEIIVRPAAGPRPDDPQFEAMIALLRPGNVDPFDGDVDLLSVAVLTNSMAERLGQALLVTHRTITEMIISLDSMTPEESEYPSLLRFLESSALGEMRVSLIGYPVAATATPTSDERMNRTVMTILSAMHRNVKASFELHLFHMALLPMVLSLTFEFVSLMSIYFCPFINHERETTTTRPLAPALAPCRVFLRWGEDTLPNEACEMLAALANIMMARPLQYLSCHCGGLGLSVQLAQSILDLAKRQKSPIRLCLCLETIAWQAGSIEILTQNCSKIGNVTINFELPETDQGIVKRAQIDLLECLQNSTVEGMIYSLTLLPTYVNTNFLDANGQERLNRIMARNQMVPLILSGRYQLTDRSFCILLPYALMVGAKHGHFFVLMAEWVAANAHRTRPLSLSPPTSLSSEHAGNGSFQDDNDNEFFVRRKRQRRT
jgi:hypothetical protein